MCQAIVKPETVLIDKHILRRAWEENKDGAGFCYVSEDRSKVIIEKGFFKFKHFWKAYKKHQQKEVLIHFRWATHGQLNVENCHPFKISEQAAIIHNGILSRFSPGHKAEYSDTRLFTEQYLIPGFLQHARSTKENVYQYFSAPALRNFIEQLIGGGNKLAIMTTQGIVLFNECLGEWHNGAWYSAGVPMEAYPSYTNPGMLTMAECWNDDVLWNQGFQHAIDRDTGSKRERVECVLCNQPDPPRQVKIDGDVVCGLCMDLEADTWRTCKTYD